MSDYLTLNETAEMFAVSTRTVRRWVDDGTIKAYRVGARLLRVDLDSVSGVYQELPPKLFTRRTGMADIYRAPTRTSRWKQRAAREFREEQLQLSVSTQAKLNQLAEEITEFKPAEMPEADHLDI